MKNHFQVSRTFQWCHKFMKMLLWQLFWPERDGKIPRGYLVMDCTIRPRTHAASVTTKEGNKTGVRGLSFWLGVHHSLTCFVRGLRSDFWKHGTSNDLQQFVFNKQWQTTSSPPHSPTLQAFIFAQTLNQALRQSHWNGRGREEEARLHTEHPLIRVSLSYKASY